jgi:hypothetical protein
MKNLILLTLSLLVVAGCGNKSSEITIEKEHQGLEIAMPARTIYFTDTSEPECVNVKYNTQDPYGPLDVTVHITKKCLASLTFVTETGTTSQYTPDMELMFGKDLTQRNGEINYLILPSKN